MADEPALTVIPISKGLRKTHSFTDPFLAEDGEAKVARCGTFTLEGGFKQHGGITPYTGSAAGGAITWMHRWYRSDGTKEFLALSKDGNLYSVSDTEPAVLSSVVSGMSGEPLSYAEINGWIYLSNGVDTFYRYDGTNIHAVGAEIPTLGSMTATEIPSSGTLDAGTYKFVVTYSYGDEGVLGESNPCVGEVTITVGANAAIYLTNIPVPARDDVEYVNIYRTEKAGNVFYWIAQLEAGVTVYTVEDGDALLVSANYELETDHDVPPKLKHIGVYRGRIFGEDPTIAGRMRLSMVNGSDVFPDNPTFYSDELGQDGQQLTGTFRLGERFFASKKKTLWMLTGDRNENFLWNEVPRGAGFSGEQAIRKGDGVVFGVGARDLQVFDGYSTQFLVKIRGLMDLISDAGKADAYGVYRDRKYYVALKPGSSTRRNLIVVVHADPVPGAPEGYVCSTIQVAYTSAGSGQNFEVASMASWPFENDRVFIGGYDGYIYEFDLGLIWNRVGEEYAGADWEWESNWIFGREGPAQFKKFHRVYLLIESDGGDVTVGYEFLTDDPTTLPSGDKSVNLNPTISLGGSQYTGRWNLSRWS